MQRLFADDDFREAIRIQQRVALCHDQESFREELGVCAALLGSEACLAVRLPGLGEAHPRKVHLINHSYPVQWLDLYESCALGAKDPVLQNHIRHGGLQLWQETYAQHPPERQFEMLATDFGLIQGMTHGLRDPSGTCHSLISFSGRNCRFSQREKLLLELLVAPLHQAVNRLVPRESPTSMDPLSSRELEILRWIYHGKTSWEIGRVLLISERTVKFHLGNVFRKLHVSNRAQAIGMALDLGILGPA